MAIVHNTLKHFKTFLIPILFFPVCPILIFFCFHISYRAQFWFYFLVLALLSMMYAQV